MKYLSPLTVIVSLLLLASCAMWAVAAPLFAPKPGILVLKNGRVISGGVLREGDRYIVTLGERGEQGELKIPVADVALVCRDLVDAYEHKRDSIRQLATKPHLELADWCITQGLLDRAADEIVTARTIDPRDSHIPDVERRLKLASAPPVDKALPQYALPPTQADIAATIRTLPDDAVRHFTTAVEPILLSRCAVTACHGPGSRSDFHLVRPPQRHVNTTRETQRNLFASLAQVMPEGESPLLTVPQQPHGGAKTPVLDARDRRQIERISAWIGMIQQSTTKPQTVKNARDEQVRPATYEEPIETVPSVRNQLRRLPKVDGEAKPIPQEANTSSAPATVRDPFDPEIFNQQVPQRGAK